ncbi:tRNA (guanosine(37)-N1)-methyltransferase TrmD [candidate division KSB1 bacterium]|nr:tRNA (guanosine(37)-N1)-methyltransferase TrmD [candidate division KSB1 bacterium]
MNIHILTIFPEFFKSALETSILKRAIERELVVVDLYDIRAFTTDKHSQVDDYPYGGGPGMIMKPEPIFKCIEHVLSNIDEAETRELVFLTPQGRHYDQNIATDFIRVDHLILLCGHYKGIDERVREYWSMREISLGDFVMSGGEPAAIAIIDSVVRLLPGVLSDINSAVTDSFYENNLLDCPHYTRPEEFRGMKVPSVLISGNHAEIANWRRRKSLERTFKYRKDLLSDEDIKELNDEI